MSAGIDYAFSPHPSIAAMNAAGVRFVMRYTSRSTANDANGKNLVPAECKALLGAGFQVGMVAEDGADMMLLGHPAGVATAQHADAVVKALGMPGLPVYYAADFDATPAQQAPINAFLDGAASVTGRDRVGVYGGYYVVKRALDAGKARYAWQTPAWSGGQWDKRAQLRQGLSFKLDGASVDHDTALDADFGQWPRPAPPAGGKTWQDWHSDGKTSLAQLGGEVGMWPSHILAATGDHRGGTLDDVSANYVTGVFKGDLAPGEPIPRGATLRVLK